MQKPRLALTDLEERLAAPGGKALRDALTEQADAVERRLRTRIAAGVSRNDFPLWHAAAEAAHAAREVLARYPCADTDDTSAHPVLPLFGPTR